jgi:hypothetical protein
MAARDGSRLGGVAILVAVAAVAVAFVAWLILQRGSAGGIAGTPWRSVVRVALVQIPEGSAPPAFESHPASSAYDLARLTPYAPDVLPAAMDQHGCDTGTDMVLALSDGRTIVYGPCRYPTQITHLWAGLVYVVSDGACSPHCGPAGQAAVPDPFPRGAPQPTSDFGGHRRPMIS